MIVRAIESKIKERVFKGKAIILLGARQTGKSTLVKSIIKEIDYPSLTLNGDEADIREQLSNTNATALRNRLGSNRILVIDEAQRIENIGLTLKIITDQLEDVQVIATGSSSFELSGKVNEPLTGRKYEFMLYPLSFGEMVKHHGLIEEQRMLQQRMVFGYYPEVVTHQEEAKERLKLLASSYLYKDLLAIEEIKKPALLDKLLKALALQIGQEVRFNELAQLTGSDPKTIERYINLLEKAFVVFQLPAFSRNVRNEIKKGRKIYFHDCGMRNAILGNFRPLESRTDTGALWENLVISERLKYTMYNDIDAKHYFWRTTQQQEIDLIEETDKGITAVEFKWSHKGEAPIPKTFLKNYDEVRGMTVTPANVEQFLMS